MLQHRKHVLSYSFDSAIHSLITSRLLVAASIQTETVHWHSPQHPALVPFPSSPLPMEYARIATGDWQTTRKTLESVRLTVFLTSNSLKTSGLSSLSSLISSALGKARCIDSFNDCKSGK